MSIEDHIKGCTVHGPKIICKHTTGSCPLIQKRIFNHQIPANDSRDPSPTKSFPWWKEAAEKFYSDFTRTKQSLSLIIDSDQQATAERAAILNNALKNYSDFLELSLNFLNKNTNLSTFEKREVIELCFYVRTLMSQIKKQRKNL